MLGGVPSDGVTQLVRDHYEVVYRFAYRLSGNLADAEDLTQQTFTIACRKMDQIQDATKARSWLFTIVRHAFLKSRRKSPHNQLSLEPGSDLPEPGSQASVPEHIDEEQLQQALGKLPDTYRIPLMLFYFDDLSYKEIADQLEVPLGTVMSRLARGKAFLKEQLQPLTSLTPQEP
jgi:RNA polymerase sigma-70 factor (ECF subfamily)